MKRGITFVMLALVTACFFNFNANANSDFEKAMLKAKKNLTRALYRNNESDILKSRGEFERILQLKEQQWLVNYYIALADKGLSTIGSINQKTDDIKKYTESGIDLINKSLDENPDFADSYVLLESLNFNRWQYEQEKMQEIIAATQSADENAKRLDPNNPRYVLISGIASFYTPEQYGGGMGICIPLFEKSIKLFENRQEKSELYPDWGQDLAMGYMALSLIKRDDETDMKNARTILDDAMKMFPESTFLSAYVDDEYKKSEKEK